MSAARAASTKATIVPMSGMTMLTIAHTSAAMANGSTRGALPHPPAPPGTTRTGRLRLRPDRHRAGVVGDPVRFVGRLRSGHRATLPTT